MKFEDLGLAELLLRALREEGYTTPTPIQAKAIPAVLSGRDVIGIAQTGTGKTAAFALPILNRLISSATEKEAKSGQRVVRVLVLASTRELAVQIHESFRTYGAFAAYRVATIYGGVGQQPQVAALRRGVDIVVATPGRLLDLIQQGCVNLSGLHTLVLDEADRMLDMGFFPAIRRVLEHVPKKRQTLMFSATMKPEIRELANSILNSPVSISVIPEQKTTELVDQSVCFVPQKQKTRLLIELLRQQNPSRAIVFSRTKHGADRIVRHLSAAGFRSEAIHANKSQNRRQRVLEEFKGTRPPVLVATDIAARGIDVDLVSHVYLHDMPTEEETYVHRIGRSGRAGASGIAVSLCDPDERRMLRSIEKLIGMKISVIDVPGFEDDGSGPSEQNSATETEARRGRRGRSGSRESGIPVHPHQARMHRRSTNVGVSDGTQNETERSVSRRPGPEIPRKTQRPAPQTGRRESGNPESRESSRRRSRNDSEYAGATAARGSGGNASSSSDRMGRQSDSRHAEPRTGRSRSTVRSGNTLRHSTERRATAENRGVNTTPPVKHRSERPSVSSVSSGDNFGDGIHE